MDKSENKKRVLDLLWRHFDDAVATVRRFQDRSTVVVAATTAAIGLLLSPATTSVPLNKWTVSFAASALLLYGLSFFTATMLWLPRLSQRPGKTDVDHLWQFLVEVEDDVGAATLMGDLCKAIQAERQSSNEYGKWLVGCMACSGLSVVLACVYAVLR